MSLAWAEADVSAPEQFIRHTQASWLNQLSKQSKAITRNPEILADQIPNLMPEKNSDQQHRQKLESYYQSEDFDGLQHPNTWSKQKHWPADAQGNPIYDKNNEMSVTIARLRQHFKGCDYQKKLVLKKDRQVHSPDIRECTRAVITDNRVTLHRKLSVQPFAEYVSGSTLAGMSSQDGTGCRIFSGKPCTCKQGIFNMVDCCNLPTNVNFASYMNLLLMGYLFDKSSIHLQSNYPNLLTGNYQKMREPLMQGINKLSQPAKNLWSDMKSSRQ